MAKHRKPKKQAPPSAKSSWLSAPEQSVGAGLAKHAERRRPPALILAGSTAIAMSAALVFGHATETTAFSSQIELTAAGPAAIGIGGRGDPTSSNIPAKINGSVVPFGYTYIPVEYPASYFIDDSVDQGVPVLHQAILANAGQDIVVIGYSEGTLVAEEERRALAGSAIDPNKLKFTMIASPNVPNGGIYGRFPHLNLLILSSNGPAQPSQFDTTYYTNEYDPYADFPAYFNPLSLANSLVAVFYVHPDKYYDTITGSTTTTVVPNSAGGTDTYIFIHNADGALPLFQPVRDLSGALGIAFLTEPVLSGAEPVVRLIIDMGYTDRENLDPATPTRFRLITPPGRIIQTVVQMPGAIAQGANNFVSGATSATSFTPFTATSGPTSSSSLRAASESPVVQQAPLVTKPKDPVPEDNSASQPKPRSQTPPQSINSGYPFSISPVVDNGSKTAPDNTKTRRLGDGRLINAVKDAVTNVFGLKPKHSTQPDTSQSPSPPSTPSQGQQSPAA
ncbi:PE-PPE domain-containing protein [Mycobacterium sp.]|uniref:PE-PPE domain-containing protein n=1 Tax=Mycobacterium sp. TaxID=1785 RepID=UPI003C775696